MKLIRIVVGSISGLALLGMLVPAFAEADNSPGHLRVYVMIINPSTDNHDNHHSPSDVTINVSGDTDRASSFPGSQSGVDVSVHGSYAVQASPLTGYNADYSIGCTGTIMNDQHATCIVVEHANAQYPSVQPYPYPYTNSILTCAPAAQTVGFGQTATFTATGGSGPYTWTTPTQTYQSIGPVLNVVLPFAGVQAVTVQSGGQSATCTVSVRAVGVVLTPTYVPALPNTGFEPMTAASIAFAIVALLGLSFAFFPYVRKAFAIVLS